MAETAKTAQEKSGAKPEPRSAAKTEGAKAAKSATEERLEAEVRAAEQKSAQDKAALLRVRRRLTRLMLTSVTMTFIALAVVGAAIFYKIAHTRSAAQAVAQNAQQNAAAAQAAQEAQTPFIQTAPNSGAEEAFARAEQPAAKADLAADSAPNIPLEAGETVQETRLSGNLALLRLATPQAGAAKFIIYDYAKKQIVARFSAAPQ